MIVERLLELAALESRRADAALGHIPLNSVVRGAYEAALGAAALGHVTLTCRIVGTAQVCGDPPLLAQAVGNLVQNALEFTPRGGSVSLVLRTEGTQAVVVVEDSGPGVPDYALARVFERFYSLPRPGTGRKSSGLGLSIVREIARVHGGDARLENRAEGGARGILALPLV